MPLTASWSRVDQSHTNVNDDYGGGVFDDVMIMTVEDEPCGRMGAVMTHFLARAGISTDPRASSSNRGKKRRRARGAQPGLFSSPHRSSPQL